MNNEKMITISEERAQQLESIGVNCIEYSYCIPEKVAAMFGDIQSQAVTKRKVRGPRAHSFKISSQGAAIVKGMRDETLGKRAAECLLANHVVEPLEIYTRPKIRKILMDNGFAEAETCYLPNDLRRKGLLVSVLL